MKDETPEKYILDRIRKYVYDNREWTGTIKQINRAMKSKQYDLKFYFEQYDLMLKRIDKE